MPRARVGYPVDEKLAVGGLLGRQVTQKWDGTMIYDVRDTGRAYGYGVRGSVTNIELSFHTDNALARLTTMFMGRQASMTIAAPRHLVRLWVGEHGRRTYDG